MHPVARELLEHDRRRARGDSTDGGRSVPIGQAPTGCVRLMSTAGQSAKRARRPVPKDRTADERCASSSTARPAIGGCATSSSSSTATSPTTSSSATRAAASPTDDLRQLALMAIIHAVERFDPDVGVAFSTFASRTIEGELKRYFRDRTWSVRPAAPRPGAAPRAPAGRRGPDPAARSVADRRRAGLDARRQRGPRARGARGRRGPPGRQPRPVPVAGRRRRDARRSRAGRRPTRASGKSTARSSCGS